MCPHFYSLRLVDSFLALACQQSLQIRLWHPSSWRRSLGPAATAHCSSHVSWPLSWGLTAGLGTSSLPFLISPFGVTACWLSAVATLHAAPYLAPFGPRKHCSPNTALFRARISTYRWSSHSANKCPPAPSWFWDSLNPRPIWEIWRTILFSLKHHGKGQYWNCWWSNSRNSMSCSDKMLWFCVDGLIWLTFYIDFHIPNQHIFNPLDMLKVTIVS